MGLQSALTTALTGLQAAETTIDVVGNNVANSSTVGFKESNVLFATQFLQTQSIGSAPSASRGGTNPRQIGLGVKVAAINPDFTQGTIQISSNPLDVAIQGDGFLIVQGSQGEQLYTRNGQLQTNSENEVVTVTGNRVLGNTIDDEFNIDPTQGLVPLRIPLGSETVAQATQTAFFSGVLTPKADVGDTPGIITSEALGNFDIEFPVNDSGTPPSPFGIGDFQVVSAPNTNGSSGAASGSGSSLAAGNYEYKVTWFTNGAGNPNESAPSAIVSVPGVGAGEEIDLSNLPINSATPIWDGRRIYRSLNGGALQQVGPDLDLTTPGFNDDGTLATGATLNDDALDQGNYSYYVTFYNTSTQLESRPTARIGALAISDTSSRIRIDDLPQPTTGDFDSVRIYRNLANSSSEFHLVNTTAIPIGTTSYIDTQSDADIEGNPEIDLMGAKAGLGTALTDVVLRNGDTYTRPFVPGTLSFSGERGGRTLTDKELTVTSTTTVQELLDFMDQAFGIDNNVPGNAGGELDASTGEIRFTSNMGIENALGVNLSSFTITPTGSTSATPVSIDFNETQVANGQGSTTDFVAFDSLGIPVSVRITTVMEDKTGTSRTYRWFATSSDNEPLTGVDTFLDSGTIVFDNNGRIVSGDTATIGVDHPAETPLVFELDFSQVSGLAVSNAFGESNSTMTITRQDGFPPGSLTSFIVTESGLIRGVFSNGAERPLGQIEMARFANTTGLQQFGDNLYGEGVNSGEPVVGDPGESGIGTLTAGAVELSNSDIGQNLIDLILASTQYRGGARVITTAQQLLDELLNLRR